MNFLITVANNFEPISEPTSDGVSSWWGVGGFILFGILIVLLYLILDVFDAKLWAIIVFSAVFLAVIIFYVVNGINLNNNHSEAVDKYKSGDSSNSEVFKTWVANNYLIDLSNEDAAKIINHQNDLKNNDNVLDNLVAVKDSYGDYVGVKLVKTGDDTWDLFVVPLQDSMK